MDLCELQSPKFHRRLNLKGHLLLQSVEKNSPSGDSKVNSFKNSLDFWCLYSPTLDNSGRYNQTIYCQKFFFWIQIKIIHYYQISNVKKC